MPVRNNPGFQSNQRTLNLEYITGGELRVLLEDCLYTQWNQHVIDQGLPLDQHSLIATYQYQDCQMPAIFKGLTPDNYNPNNLGAELVVLPDPQIRSTHTTYRVRRWNIQIVDRSVEQNRIEIIQGLVQNMFRGGVYYVPTIDGLDSNLAFPQGLLMVDVTDHKPSIQRRNGQYTRDV